MPSLRLTLFAAISAFPLHVGCTQADDRGATLDHIILAVADLDDFAIQFAAETGVTPTVGGVHPGGGTANLLVSLGPGRYLEILGPDVDAEEPSNVGIALQALTSPRVVWFAAAPDDIDHVATILAKAGMTVIGPEGGSRKTPDDRLLAWKTVFAHGHDFGDQLPFFIDWGDSPHPSTTSVTGVTVERFVVVHPRATELGKLYVDLGIAIDVVEGSPAGFDLALKTRGGALSFESRSKDAFLMPLFVPSEND